MASPDGQGFPQWAFNWVIGLLGGLLAFFLKRHVAKVDGLAEAQAAASKNMAALISRREFEQMELRIAPLASRAELIAHMGEIRDGMDRRLDQMREDRLQMHHDNQESLKNLREDIKETRSDIRAVHERVDHVLKDRP